MKITLVVLIFVCFLHVTSAFLWFNSYVTEPTKALTTSSTSRPPTSPLQQLANQQNDQSRYKPFSFRRNPLTNRQVNINASPVPRILNALQDSKHIITTAQQGINRKANPIIIRDRFHAFPYRIQQRPLPNFDNNLVAHRPTNQTVNNPQKQVIFARLPPAAPTRKLQTLFFTMPSRRSSPRVPLTTTSKSPGNVPINHQQHSYNKVNTPVPKMNLLRTLTTSAARINAFDNRQRFLHQYNRDEQLQAFYRFLNERTTTRAQFKPNSALRRRK